MPIPIINANSIPLGQNSGTLPNMGETIMGWFQNITFTILVKTVVNYRVVETPTVTDFLGVVESQTPEKLSIKPEGQRSWNWISVWALPNLIMKNDDKFVYLGKTYRVMNRIDWKSYGYLEYEAIEDYGT